MRKILLRMIFMVSCAGVLHAAESPADLPAAALPKDARPVPLVEMKLPAFRAEPGDSYALAISTEVREQAEVAVKFKTQGIDGDQVAGIVFRYKDAKNYYAMVVSVKDDNCTLYRVKEGKRKAISTQETLVAPMAWHELRITFARDRITGLVEQDLVIGTKDSTFKDPGPIGLITGLATPVSFSDFRASR